jgi:hypothetical protein
MQALESAFESAAKQGKGRAIGIVANAGVGKSGQCFEFAERRRAAALSCSRAPASPMARTSRCCRSSRSSVPYFEIDERDDPRQGREKVAGRLLLIDDSFRDVLPLVFDFLGLPDPERPTPPMDAEARRRRVVAVIRRLIERGNPGGFVILIDDLHWLDAASDAFVADYVDAIANGPGLLHQGPGRHAPALAARARSGSRTPRERRVRGAAAARVSADPGHGRLPPGTIRGRRRRALRGREDRTSAAGLVELLRSILSDGAETVVETSERLPGAVDAAKAQAAGARGKRSRARQARVRLQLPGLPGDPGGGRRSSRPCREPPRSSRKRAVAYSSRSSPRHGRAW